MGDNGKMELDPTVLVLGFTGPIGSGSTYIAKAISDSFNYKYYKLSDVIRAIIKKEGGDPNNIQSLQDKGNFLRETKGRSFLVEQTFNKYLQKKANIGEHKGVIIDGIKNEGELEALRHFANFFLISVHANRELRRKRLLDDKLFATKEEFDEADIRDQLEESIYGQQVKKCDYQSDIIILNNHQIQKRYRRKKQEFIEKIRWRYLDHIENYTIERITISNPTENELCMTMAYSISKMSSCLKRKVGAVIIQESDSKAQDNVNDNTERHLKMPTIVSTGYNDVPLGSYKCAYDPDYQMCYRDFLQAKHASKVKHCPACGKKINIDVKCKECGKSYKKFVNVCKCGHEIDVKYICDCGKEVFKEFIPGAKYSPGKLLDVCRALHAEENAILSLVKNNVASNDLILYTTTQPCNLCANKIVNAGIKKLIYSEPYTMEEADEILRYGNVEVERFEGIKSNAFFKLYK